MMKTKQKKQRPPRWGDIPASLLLAAALFTAAIRLGATQWVDHLSLIQGLSMFGLMAGTALGLSLFSRRIVVGLTVIYGLFMIGWLFGSTMANAIYWSERLSSLGGRLWISLSRLVQQKPVNDPLLFLFLMSCLFWSLSVHAGYILNRHGHPWQAGLPAGLALFIIHIYDPYWPYRSWYLATYIFFLLLLLARMNYLHRYAGWQKSRTRLPPYLGLDLIRTTLLATAILIVMAWSAPALADSLPIAERAWQRASTPWIKMRDRMSNAFASLRATVGLVSDYYGDVLNLGRGNVLTDSHVMSVGFDEPPGHGTRYYWRSRVYDFYEDHQWTSTLDTQRTLTPQQFDLQFPDLTGRQTVQFTFTTMIPISVLYTAPQPQWVSRPVKVDLSTNTDGTVDLAAIRSTTFIRAGETYEAHSSVTTASVAELQAAGSDYPDWVMERYLQLPPTVTPRTRELAQQITSDLETPYDKAAAITSYLRENIRYNTTVPTRPRDHDPVDWVLFELKQGFCNYYASAEIVLLRSLGIPARMAVGYAQGEHDEQSRSYTIRQRDAHAWPEVYFPGIGWVEFEPTVNQSPLVRLPGDDSTDDLNQQSQSPDLGASPGEQQDDLLLEEDTLEPEFADAPARNILLTALAVGLSMGLILLATFAWRRGRARGLPPFPVLMETGIQRVGLHPPRVLSLWAQQAQLTPLARAYTEINKALIRIGSPPDLNATPAERATALVQALPAAEVPTHTLLTEYQATTYSPRRGDDQLASRAARTIRNLSWLAFLRRLLAFFQEPATPPLRERARF